MLTDTQLKRYADVLLWGLTTARSKPFKRGDVVLVRFNLDAIRLAEILESRILEMGLNPVRRINPTPAMEKNFFSLANRRQLVFDPPGEAAGVDYPFKHHRSKKNQPVHPFQKIFAGYFRRTRTGRAFQLDPVYASYC